MWITLCLVALVWSSRSQARADFCKDAVDQCQQAEVVWTRCYEERIMTCRYQQTRIPDPNPRFVRRPVNSSQEAEVFLGHHRVHVPSSALRMSRGVVTDEEVQLVTAVIDSKFFQLSPQPESKGGKGRSATRPLHRSGSVMGSSVLVVKAGNSPVRNLLQPIKLIFKHELQQSEDATCVFWQDSDQMDGKGLWSAGGCETNRTETELVCSCNHLSFFAVLVNPIITVEKRDAVVLSYITYIGSALSVIFTFISLIIYACLQRWRPEKAIGVHMHLTGALLCLHLSFLLCSLLVGLLNENEEDWLCQGLGLLLHWSLLATFTWAALEGFHLYLLLVRVFNIYIRRYLLKLSLVGWGLPTAIVIVCGISGVYGKYYVDVKDDNSQNSTAPLCYVSRQFPQRLLVSYATTVAFPGLVVLSNSCMLALVVFKLWQLRRGRGSGWTNLHKNRGSRLRKDCATLLGLSCVLGLSWGLASTTYVSLPGIYIFTILNALQGVFMFLWSLALISKSHSDNNSTVRDTSSQKMMTTSFNS